MTTIRERPLDSPMTWAAETLLENDGLLELDAECRAEPARRRHLVRIRLREEGRPFYLR